VIARAIVASAMLLTASCGEAPSAIAQADADVPAETGEQLVTERKKTIEEAAEEATRLIEADAKSEADAAVRTERPTDILRQSDSLK